MKKITMSTLMAIILLGLMACGQPVASEIIRSEK